MGEQPSIAGLTPSAETIRQFEKERREFLDGGGKCVWCRDTGRTRYARAGEFCRCAKGRAVKLEWEEEEKRKFHEAGGACFTCRDTGGNVSYPCRECDRGEVYREAQRRASANTKPFQGRTLDTWLSVSGGPPALTAALRDWEESWPGRRPSLLLHGPTGTGKSSLAAALLDDAMRRTGKGGWRWEVPELIAALRPGPDQDETALQRARETPLLFLDDLGVTKPSEWVEEQIYRVVNARYERNKWTIITTNQSPDDSTLLDRIGERIFWRIHESSLSVEVNHGNLRDR